ncbi:MAG TPA: glycosyltransferase [Phycisphaerae bacterium]|nr:glycosyltransferase [Phycisphaerales bacterium]HRX86134.1 glycosyltransferase [Phycisphaerae bacterium]
MSGVLHVLDRTCGWEQRIAVTQLAERASAAFPASVGCLGAPPPGFDPAFPLNTITRSPRSPLLTTPALRRHMTDHNVAIVHAWGSDALAPAAAAVASGGAGGAHTPRLVTTVFDPAVTDDHVRLIRTICTATPTAVICAAERVRRRLVERGVPYEHCVVVRPAVDFSAIKAVDAHALRAALTIRPEMRWFVIPPPLPGRDGDCAALWAVLMRRYLDEPVHLTIPGTGPRIERLKALTAVSGHHGSVTFCGDAHRFEELCVAADDLILGDISEIPMTAAAWAMAGNTLISAPATYAISEILANDLNAKLFKAPENWRRRAARLAARLDHPPDAAKIRDVARGQAYEVFSRRRFARQVEQVYTNLAENKPPAEGIGDPALVGAA